MEWLRDGSAKGSGSLSSRVRVEQAGEKVGCRGGRTADSDSLDCAAQPTRADELAFERSEDSQCEQCDEHGELKCGRVVADQHVWKQRDKASGDVGRSNGQGRAVGPVGGRLFEAKLEAHHEIDPGGGVLFERGENRRSAGAVNRVLLKDLVDLFF